MRSAEIVGCFLPAVYAVVGGGLLQGFWVGISNQFILPLNNCTHFQWDPWSFNALTFVKNLGFPPSSICPGHLWALVQPSGSFGARRSIQFRHAQAPQNQAHVGARVGAGRSNRASSSQKVGAADGTLSGQSLVVTKGLKPHGAAEGAGHASSGQSRHRNRSWPGKVRGRIRPNRSQLSVAPPGPIIRQVLCFNGVSGVTIIAFSPTAIPLNSQLGSRKPHTSWHETWDSIDAQTELSVASI